MNERMNDNRHSLEAQLARLADGSLPAARASELRSRVEADPELAAALAEQRRAVSLLGAIDLPAPPPLRARVMEMTQASTAQTTRRRLPLRPGRTRAALIVSAVTALAVLGVAIALVLGAGASAPTVPQTVHVTLAGATLPAPSADPAHPTRLELQVGGVHFPDWEAYAGWWATGARTDTIGGRRVFTVFYGNGAGRRIGYAIVSGPPLRRVQGKSVQMNGVWYTMSRHGSTVFIAWEKRGHTCVIAGTSVSSDALLDLATYVA